MKPAARPTPVASRTRPASKSPTGDQPRNGPAGGDAASCGVDPNPTTRNIATSTAKHTAAAAPAAIRCRPRSAPALAGYTDDALFGQVTGLARANVESSDARHVRWSALIGHSIQWN
jgi:hypothetical protein